MLRLLAAYGILATALTAAGSPAFEVASVRVADGG